jgi:ATP-dependent DNA helicase DinG
MVRDVLKAYNEKGISLIEAGTGTGKSLAYLIPAVLWAKITGARTVVSTKTIALQEQLLLKDIPLVSKIIGNDVKAVIVKGISNYLCLRKLVDSQHELPGLHENEALELDKIEAWSKVTKDGSKSSLPFVPHPLTWEKVCAESDTCTNQRCEFYKDCHFFKAREEAATAQILISNHHLLFADLQRRSQDDNYDDAAILPHYTGVILDEAHHIEEIATEYFASKVGRINLLKILARIGSEKGIKMIGKLGYLRDQFHMHYSQSIPEHCHSISRRLMHDLPIMRKQLQEHIHQAYMDFDQFVSSSQRGEIEGESPVKENKLRILPSHRSHNSWKSMVEEPSKMLVEELFRFSQAIRALENDLKCLDDEKLNEKTKTVRFELSALTSRLSEAAEALQLFHKDIDNANRVQWIESQRYKTMINTTLVNAELDIAKSLAATLFNPFKSVVLCSATMTQHNSFDYMRKSLGITPELLPNVTVRESIYESPFNYSKQVLFAVPTDLPSPQDANFSGAATEKIWDLIQASRGNAFVLFTSFQALQECHQQLEPKLREQRYTVLKHGQESRQILLEKFKNTDRSVLFGTDTFWEGVDIAGDALRCVIIVKLPFKVPSEPIIQARTEAIQSRGGDPFREYALPNAIVKFRQGFGRLIRNKSDRGCVICLDGRLINKNYGKLFLKSLPLCQQAFDESGEILKQMADFYRRTYRSSRP